ncbi:hypothetical protein DPM19_29410 [Actinomadura craniellae]|uniref:Uncharacterized protein n=1 Tax=Actinomadura craniellae TaxID=2231787 RepID=A0A365GY19_9ACTN|nr:DUF5691 domain-containing protein [Actinomadura craniellae]RAY11730.1 hypothetical protein DPM19_29410 [Actinomadura craniellae]
MTAWSDHVTTALLGTRRRPLPPHPVLAPALAGGPAANAPAGTGDAAAGALLEQAALLTVRRRAGLLPGTAEPIAPAPAESLPPAGLAAAGRLARILAGEQPRMLAEWLDAAAGRGLRVPAPLLPDLLERGRSDRALRPAIARVAGRRGVWLALQHTGWAYLVAESGDPGDDPEVWQTGTRSQRVAYLVRLRGDDPAAAREALAATWSGEPAPDRTAFLGTFAQGLSPADEEFLEAALDDRGKDVRQLAADLLARLPGSAYGRRMSERARACVRARERTVRGRRQTWIMVREPEEHDEGMARDGIPFHPPGSFAPGSGPPLGARAGWLREILARTPLPCWTELFGLPPMEVACLPIADHTEDVHVGWARAAIRQHDAGWARALLKAAVVTERADELTGLLGVLPAAERETAGADLVRRVRWMDEIGEMTLLLDRLPGPWTGALADAVLEVVEDILTGRAPTRSSRSDHLVLSRLCERADRWLDPAVAPRLEALAARRPDHQPLTELTEALRFRLDMLRELDE